MFRRKRPLSDLSDELNVHLESIDRVSGLVSKSFSQQALLASVCTIGLALGVLLTYA